MTGFFFLFAFLTVVVPSVGAGEMKDILHELDKTIERREMFRSQKERRILDIKEELQAGNPAEEFSLCHKLFEEYKYYQYDSAYYYARRLETIASDSGKAGEVALAQSALLFCFKSVGFFNEAVDVIDDFERQRLGGGITRRHTGFILYALCRDVSEFEFVCFRIAGSCGQI